MEDHAVFKSKILTKSSTEIANAPLFEILYDITDGQDDKQIDAIVINESDSIIYIIQGKYGPEKLDAEPLREVLSSWQQIKNLVRLEETGNEKLRLKLLDVSNALDDDYKIVFELICTAELTDSAKEDARSFQDRISKDEELEAEIDIIDDGELKERYELARDLLKPSIEYQLNLESGKYILFEVSGTRIVIAALQLKECVKFPGIRDGTLFQKDVRQSLGLTNRVNKSMKSTIYSDRHRDFFFYHNGITALCNKFELNDNILSLKGLNVVNGCQSLNTILACSQKVKELNDTYIMIRFYEIPQADRAYSISISTNLQTAVKPRDLRSTDKRILKLKHTFEQKYPQGYFITKRGENRPADKDLQFVIEMVDLGKYLISWHSQRPNIAYSETKIFDKYFEQLFKREYNAENIQALNSWMQEVKKGWEPKNGNPFGLNESLLAMKAYAPYHQLYAISQCFIVASKQNDRVPTPNATYHKAKEMNMIDRIVNIAATSLNFALETAANEQQPNRVFSPQNWIKTKTCLSGINAAIAMQFMMLQKMPGGEELREALIIPTEEFEYRWAAD